jgi:glycerophosphoryl diester phosphodiesterase
VIVSNANAKTPRTVGHRGASALAPENTLRAFEVAIEHGLDLAELDVQLSRDGQLVVIHDNTLPEPDGRPVAELTAEELKHVDVGDGRGVPRLTEVFAVARGRLGLYVELKGPGTGEAFGRLVQTGAAEGVELIGGSFRPIEVAALRDVAPGIPRSVLFARTGMAEMLATCAELETTYAHPCFRPVDQEMIDRFHGAGLQVMTPHTNELDEARAFARLGVDVIASDDPRILIGLVGPG